MTLDSSDHSFFSARLTLPYCEVASALHKTGFDFPWSTESFRSLLTLPSTIGWIDETGLLVCSQVCDEMEILTICIAPAQRAQGRGFRWLMFLFDYARIHHVSRIFLEVAENNIPARQLYEKAGFSEIGRRKNYYKTKSGFCDAVCMAKTVSA